MSMTRTFALGGAAIALVAAAAAAWWWQADSSARLDPDDAELVQLGATIYAAQCASCHGANLEGQPDWRTRRADGRLPAPPHDGSGHTWHHDDAMLVRLTRFGPQTVAGSDYQSDMPAYDGVLSEQQIVAVLSFIKSRWPPQVRAHHDRINAASGGG